MANVGSWVNVTVGQDWVETMFSDIPLGARTQQGTHGYTISAPQYGHITAHSAIWQDDALRTLWWRFWQQHAACQESWDDKTNTLHGCL